MGMNQKKAHKPDWLEQRRWRALELKRDGWTHEEVAEALGVTRSVFKSVYGITAECHPSANVRFRDGRQRFFDRLEQGRFAAGFSFAQIAFDL